MIIKRLEYSFSIAFAMFLFFNLMLVSVLNLFIFLAIKLPNSLYPRNK